MIKNNVDVLIGLQYGSEGKGIVAGALALSGFYAASVRVGGSNAGHSFRYKGKMYVYRHVPCAAINPEMLLMVGRGALVDPEVLVKECEAVECSPHRLQMDPFVFPILPIDGQIEKAALGLSEKIGSTCKGVGQALSSRIMRSVWDERKDILKDYTKCTMPELMARVGTKSVLVESTQGTSLSLYSDNYPYVTSRDISVPSILAECRLPISSLGAVIGVVRTFPIRVAGNSGPMKNETSWEAISEAMGRPITEKTTVTHKTRRVAAFDYEQVEEAVELNDVGMLVVTFMDYLHPDAGKARTFEELPQVCKDFVDDLERRLSVPVLAVTNGDDVEKNFLWLPDAYRNRKNNKRGVRRTA
jgi:adenylosuccinate synthase